VRRLGECRRTYSFNPPRSGPFRCAKRGLFGLCVEHHLERLRWKWKTRRFYVEVDLGNINRPYIQIDEDRPISYVAFSYGNGYSDPVLTLQWNRERR
jgi:hypothetical protein